jgi:hypothetical protein
MAEMLRLQIVRMAIEVCLLVIFLWLLGAIPGFISDRDSTVADATTSLSSR